MDTIGKIAASVAARPEKQEAKNKVENQDQGTWGLDLRWVGNDIEWRRIVVIHIVPFINGIKEKLHTA